MTETNRYENGKIYKLVSPHTDKIYIGSTCKKYLSQRLTKHKSHYKDWLKDNDSYTTSYRLFELGDVEIVLLESINCNTKDELLKKEREYIEKYKDILVNKNIPSRTSIEYRMEHKEDIKQYRKNHKKEISEKSKEYYEKHKEEISEKGKERYEKHKEEINKKHKQKYDCICGKQLRIGDKSTHNKTKHHINFISNQ